MIKRKSISIWLILNDGKNKGKIILQRRSFRERTFSYISQATWSGKVEVHENIKDAVKRECKEEMGREFFKSFNFSKLKIISKDKFIWEDKGETWIRYNYIGAIDSGLLKKIKFHDGAFSRPIIIGKNDTVYSIKSKKNPKNKVILFDDQYKILKKILNGAERNTK